MNLTPIKQYSSTKVSGVRCIVIVWRAACLLLENVVLKYVGQIIERKHLTTILLGGNMTQYIVTKTESKSYPLFGNRPTSGTFVKQTVKGYIRNGFTLQPSEDRNKFVFKKDKEDGTSLTITLSLCELKSVADNGLDNLPVVPVGSNSSNRLVDN